MPNTWDLDKISISVKSHQLLKQLLTENPQLEEIMTNARNETEALIGVRNWVRGELEANPDAVAFSVFLLHMAAPTIDYYTQPRVFGQGGTSRE